MKEENSSAIERLRFTRSLLKVEQEEDRKQYKEKVLQTSLTERKNQGVTWYPIVIKDAYYGMGGRLVIEVERPQNISSYNQFQTGSLVSLFSNFHNDGPDNPSVSGIVNAVRANVLKLTLSVDELPEWTSSGKLGLDLLFDESSYKEMDMAMDLVIKAEKSRLAELREILSGNSEAGFTTNFVHQIPALNEFQNEAFARVARADDVAIIHGPPGTGKTTTLIECILHCLKEEKQVLVCAPSNTAVDLLTEKLSQRGVHVLRIGNPARVNEALLAHTLDFKTTSHPQYKQIKEFRKKAAELKNMASKYKRNFGKEERDQRRMVFDEAKKFVQEADKLEKYITDDLITKSQVIAATLVGSNNYQIRDKRYKTIFIDEAGQALEPACWIPILKATKVVMAGDHKQLPPTIKSADAAKKGLSQTLMEKSIQRKNLSSMLRIQYRMHEFIMNFPNQQFYKNELIAADTVKNKLLHGIDGKSIDPLEFLDTAGCGFTEKAEQDGQGLSNAEEADFLLKRLKIFLDELENPVNSIGVISPYRSQINYLKQKIAEDEVLSVYSGISVNTVDGFQGQERDVICISLVRSNEAAEIGFLADTRRMNVAMTRAKMKLIIVGDSATLGQHPFYSALINYSEGILAYKSAWEYNY